MGLQKCVGRFGLGYAKDVGRVAIHRLACDQVGVGQGPSDIKNRKDFEFRYMNNDVRVACGTLIGAGTKHLAPLRFSKGLVDECAQVTEPETLVFLQLLNDDAFLTLVGDHQQLPPTVTSPAAAFAGLQTSLFERLWHTPGLSCTMLTVQYRMHPSISAWPSQEFYHGQLLNDITVTSLQPLSGFPWPSDQSNVAFVHCDGPELMIGTSHCNADQVRLTEKLLKRLFASRDLRPEEVGVITCFGE